MALFGMLPGYTRVLLHCQNLNNRMSASTSLNLLRKAEQSVREEPKPVDENRSTQIAVWQDAPSYFDTDLDRPKSLLETLVNRARTGKTIPEADPLTNLMRAFALQSRLPIGGDDLDQVSGNLWLRPARGNELFAPINQPELAQTPNIGEIIYVDDSPMVLCRHWNVWPGDHTKLTSDTQNAIVFLDTLPPLCSQQAIDSGNRLARLINGFLKSDVEIFALTSENPVATLKVN